MIEFSGPMTHHYARALDHPLTCGCRTIQAQAPTPLGVSPCWGPGMFDVRQSDHPSMRRSIRTVFAMCALKRVPDAPQQDADESACRWHCFIRELHVWRAGRSPTRTLVGADAQLDPPLSPTFSSNHPEMRIFVEETGGGTSKW